MILLAGYPSDDSVTAEVQILSSSENATSGTYTLVVGVEGEVTGGEGKQSTGGDYI